MISALGNNAALFHLRGGDAHVDGGDLFNALPLIALMIYPGIMPVFSQSGVSGGFPCRPPFLCFRLVVPVVGLNINPLPLFAVSAV